MQKCCGVCGKTSIPSKNIYPIFYEVKDIYKVGFDYLCSGCGRTADSFVNYYGYKSEEDKAKLHRFLIGGILPMKDYSGLMNGGYYD